MKGQGCNGKLLKAQGTRDAEKAQGLNTAIAASRSVPVALCIHEADYSWNGPRKPPHVLMAAQQPQSIVMFWGQLLMPVSLFCQKVGTSSFSRLFSCRASEQQVTAAEGLWAPAAAGTRHTASPTHVRDDVGVGATDVVLLDPILAEVKQAAVAAVAPDIG